MALYKDEENKSEKSAEDVDALKTEIKSLTQQLKEKDREKKWTICRFA